MKRTITGRAAARSMTLGELRQFIAALESLPDEALVKARSTFRHHVRSVTVEEDDVGFDAYVRAVGSPDRVESPASADTARPARAKATEKASI
jgi:uncharacterized protein (UPF0335 family)